MYCINDLRCILSNGTHIRVWDGAAEPLYEGNLEDLQLVDPAAKATSVSMMVFSGVLVFFVCNKT